jgi:hypothetical protein
MKRAKQEDIFMRKYLHFLNEIEDNLFEHKQVREAMLLNNKGAKRGGGHCHNSVSEHKTKINNIRKFAAKIPVVGDMSKLPSGLTQVKDMKKPYIIQLWKIKHLVSFVV